MKHFSRLLLSLSSCCLLIILDTWLSSLPSLAAQKIVFQYGAFERSLPIADLRKYADTQNPTDALKSFLGYLSPKQEKLLQEALQVKLSLNLGALDQLLDTDLGKETLNIISQAIIFPVNQTNTKDNQDNIKALRSAVVLAASSTDGLGIVTFLEKYPTENIVFDVSKASKFMSMSNVFSSQTPPKDNLSASPIWQLGLEYFQLASKDRRFGGCLFGDSVSAELGNSLGENNFNFGFDGLSTISLVDQLNALIPQNLKCQKVVIAVGGNDAWYQMTDEAFRQKLVEAISLTRKMGTKKIYLVPAFYSTLATSKDPTVSASLDKVTQINHIINQVGAKEHIPVLTDAVAPLYINNALKDSLSSDGDHLNAEGLNIYRAALFQVLGK